MKPPSLVKVTVRASSNSFIYQRTLPNESVLTKYSSPVNTKPLSGVDCIFHIKRAIESG